MNDVGNYRIFVASLLSFSKFLNERKKKERKRRQEKRTRGLILDK